jgi:hypothetical protein
MMKQMEISAMSEEGEDTAAGTPVPDESGRPSTSTPVPGETGSGSRGPETPSFKALTGTPIGTPPLDASSTTSGAESTSKGADDGSEVSKSKKDKKKKSKMSKEQQAELEKLEQERVAQRKERVDALTKKLIERLSLWTETDKGEAVTASFKEKIRLEADELKMESFGLEILHAIGQTYSIKATTMLKSQGFLGIPGFFSKLREKGEVAKQTWNIITSAIDAETSIQEIAKAEEAEGATWSPEKKAEMERTMMGKLLGAAWAGSKYEIQGVLREVCDRVLHDKTVPRFKRIERAEALLLMGTIFKVSNRTPEEAAEIQMFEELVAEAAANKHRKRSRKSKSTKSHTNDDFSSELNYAFPENGPSPNGHH